MTSKYDLTIYHLRKPSWIEWDKVLFRFTTQRLKTFKDPDLRLELIVFKVLMSLICGNQDHKFGRFNRKLFGYLLLVRVIYSLKIFR